MRESNAVLPYPFTESACEKKRNAKLQRHSGRSEGRKSKRSVLKRLATGDDGKKENVTLNGDPQCNVTSPRVSHVRTNSRTGVMVGDTSVALVKTVRVIRSYFALCRAGNRTRVLLKTVYIEKVPALR